MNITKEQIDDLNAILTVELAQDDYASKVEAGLAKYRKETTMPGFRPGKVPSSAIKKRYGKAVLGEAINTLLNDSVQNHITENKLKVLGSPLPKANGEEGNWENPGTFKFQFEIGLAPEFDVKLSKRDKFTFNTVEINDEMVDRQIDDLARRYGKLEATEVAGERDMIIADIIELDAEDKIKEGGFMHTSTISIEYLTNEESKKTLTGAKAGETLVMDPHSISRGRADLAAMLNISKEAAEGLTTNVQLNLKEIKHMVAAEVNQELFDKLFGEGKVTTEGDFKARVREDLSKGFMSDSERLFQREVSEKLSTKVGLKLPDEFLKRWITSTNEKPLSEEQLEKEYPMYADSLKWQLISNKIIETNEIKVEIDEVKEHIKGMFIQQYAQYGIPAPDDKTLETNANQVLANQEEARKIFDQMYNDKLIANIKESVKIEEKAIPFDDFLKLASN
ncbi:MAG: trigger factor [Sphingobacteriales bacterium]|jgi:trigger factor